MNKAGFMSLKDSLYERIIQGMRPRFENGHRMIPKELATLIDAMVSQIPSDRPSFEDCKNALVFLHKPDKDYIDLVIIMIPSILRL